MVSTVMPFGRHRGKALSDVPSAYLRWLTTIRLFAGLRQAVAGELARRGIPIPPPPERSPPSCTRCPGAALVYRWQEDRNGHRRIRAACARCQRFVTFAPVKEPFIGMADAAASPTPILDALIGLEDLGIDLFSDGATVWFDWRDRQRVPPDLHTIVRECSHTLARLLGRKEIAP